MKIKNVLVAGILSAALAFTASAGFAAVPATVEAADKGADSVSGLLLIGDDALFVGSAMEGEHSVKTVKGATYDASSNTLTLNNFNKPDVMINASYMGSDFTINLKGNKNNVSNITSFGYGYGCDVTFKGSGKLNVNKSKSFAYGIDIQGYDVPAKVVFAKSAKVVSYAGDSGYSVHVTGTAASAKKAIVSKGGSMTGCTGSDGEFYCEKEKFVKK